MSDRQQRYFAVEISDDRRVAAIAREAELTDAALDALEEEIRAETDLPSKLALSLTIARAGRRASGGLLAELRRELLQVGKTDEAIVAGAALDLVPLRPSHRLERAESGYRWQDEETELYIEDPLAAHWHAAGRWGPPLRPDFDIAPLFYGAHVHHDRALRHAREGGIVVVTVSSMSLVRDVEPALRLTRAGFARDPSLSTLTRWSEVRSLGWMGEGRERRWAYEPSAGGPQPFGTQPSCGFDALVSLVEALLALAHSGRRENA